MDAKYIPTTLYKLRKANNYSQDDVAAALGIVRQTYSHYETGKRTPNAVTLYKLAGFYNISVDDLMQLYVDIDRDDSYDAPAPTNSGDELSKYIEFFNTPYNKRKYQYFDKLEKELMIHFTSLSLEDKQELIEIAKIKSRKHHNN